jgi:AraC family transcriptional regulator, L-rhamnose operon regulatory protein RhaS
VNSEIFEIFRRPQQLVLPELVGLGWCRTDYPRLGGVRPDGYLGFEVGYLERGSIEWWTEDGLEEAGPGSVIVDWPGDWQGGVSAIMHPCERYWVRFNFPPAGALPGLRDDTVAALAECFGGMRTRFFPASPLMKGYFEQLLAQQREPDTFAEEASRAAFHQILFQAAHDAERDQQVAFSPAVQHAVAFFDSNIDRDHRIEEVAGEVSLSIGYFHELFLREVGYSPAHYHMRRRITAAKRRLIYSDASITAISMDLGFSSSQYFATAFKKIVGLSPGAYRTLREGSANERSEAG